MFANAAGKIYSQIEKTNRALPLNLAQNMRNLTDVWNNHRTANNFALMRASDLAAAVVMRIITVGKVLTATGRAVAVEQNGTGMNAMWNVRCVYCVPGTYAAHAKSRVFTTYL